MGEMIEMYNIYLCKHGKVLGITKGEYRTLPGGRDRFVYAQEKENGDSEYAQHFCAPLPSEQKRKGGASGDPK